MNLKHNPYYSPEKVGLTMISFDEPDLCYEYNTLCFWATADGRVYTAQDSGCSCPLPFEEYEGEDQEAVLQLLERVGSVEQAVATFNSWNRTYDDKTFLHPSEVQDVENFVRAHLK